MEKEKRYKGLTKTDIMETSTHWLEVFLDSSKCDKHDLEKRLDHEKDFQTIVYAELNNRKKEKSHENNPTN